MFWQKLIIVAYYLSIWSWIITIFDPNKDPKIGAYLDVLKGPPLSSITRNKVIENQLIQGIPQEVLYDNQLGGNVLISPCRIGLKWKKG